MARIAAPDAGDPVDETLVGAAEDVDGEEQDHDGDEDGEVLKRCVQRCVSALRPGVLMVRAPFC